MIVDFIQSNYMFFMGTFFVASLFVKFYIHLTVKTEKRYIGEIYQRIMSFIGQSSKNQMGSSFSEILSNIIDRTNYEVFVLRAKNRRKQGDDVKVFFDRVFFTPDAGKYMNEDLKLQTVSYDSAKNDRPDFNRVTLTSLNLNPVFGHIFGGISINTINRVLSILPGTFIVLGIFGTFLGIVSALPELKNIDPNQITQSQIIMNTFVEKMAFSMQTSLVGIGMSLFFSFANSILSFHAMRKETMLRFSACLEFLWSDYHTNNDQYADEVLPDLPQNIIQFEDSKAS